MLIDAMLRRATLLIALLPCASVVQAQAPTCPPTVQMPSAEQMQAGLKAARDRGFLWRIDKDGRSSFLYGTIHVGKLEWAFPGKTVTAALMATELLAVEIDLADESVMRSLATSQGAADKAPPLPAPLRDRLEHQVAAACIRSTALSAFHPVMQSVTLAVLAGRWDGLDPSYAQEISLAGFARATQRPVVSLETLQSQMSALVPSDDAAALKLIEQTLAQLEQNRIRPLLTRMAAIWESGDLAELESYERWCECANTDDERAFRKRLIDDRNPHLADRIDALHRQGKKVFAAVGALHMAGPQGLPRLMAERGYRVERMVLKP